MPASSIVPNAAYLPSSDLETASLDASVMKKVLVALLTAFVRAMATVPFLNEEASLFSMPFDENSPTIGVRLASSLEAVLPFVPPCRQKPSTTR